MRNECLGSVSRSSVELTACPTSPEGFELAYRACQFVGSLIQFFEQPYVLDGDDCLIGEGFEESAICLSPENGRTSVRRITIAPIGTPSRSNGVARTVRVPTVRVLDGASGNSASSQQPCLGRESFADQPRLGPPANLD